MSAVRLRGLPAKPQQLTAGLWRWTARHPEWHPGEFGSEVASFALKAGSDTILIDPLLPPEPEPVLSLIEKQLGDRLAMLITIPYHVRSSEAIRERFGRQVETTIWGHKLCAKRLERKAGFHAFEAGDDLPGGAEPLRIGKPRRSETPLLLPSHRALAFGDAVAAVDGSLRVWSDRRVDDDVLTFYRERFNPTLELFLDLDFDRVLVTHGQPVMKDGKAALRTALRKQPWFRT